MQCELSTLGIDLKRTVSFPIKNSVEHWLVASHQVGLEKGWDHSRMCLGLSYNWPTHTGAGHQWTVSISTGCNMWLSLAEPTLKVTPIGRNRSLVACTSMCGCAISHDLDYCILHLHITALEPLLRSTAFFHLLPLGRSNPHRQIWPSPQTTPSCVLQIRTLGFGNNYSSPPTHICSNASTPQRDLTTKM